MVISQFVYVNVELCACPIRVAKGSKVFHVDFPP